MLSITCNTAASGAQQLLTLAVPVHETGELAIVRLENIPFQVASLLQYMSPTVPQQHRIALSPQAPQVACHLMPNKRRPRNQNASQAQNTRYPLTQQILSPFFHSQRQSMRTETILPIRQCTLSSIPGHPISYCYIDRIEIFFCSIGQRLTSPYTSRPGDTITYQRASTVWSTPPTPVLGPPP